MSPKSAPYRLKVGEGLAWECCWCDGGLRRCTGVAGARTGGSAFDFCRILGLRAVAASGGGGGAGALLVGLLSLSSSCCFFFDALLSSNERFASTALMSGTEASSSPHDDEDKAAAAVALSIVADGAVGACSGAGLQSSAMARVRMGS